MSMLSILLQEQAATSTNGWMSLGMMLLIFVVFYFFLIRPQSKRQKEIRKFQDSLENGRRVITSGGIYGKIKEVKDLELIHLIGDRKYGSFSVSYISLYVYGVCATCRRKKRKSKTTK